MLTTRYEIPCLVPGTVTVDGETFTVDGQGQRDHSWGVRDWWAFGWCWCSLRLDDGTRVHLADIRMPGHARSSSDTSRPRAPVNSRHRRCRSPRTWATHGFPSPARIEIAAAPRLRRLDLVRSAST